MDHLGISVVEFHMAVPAVPSLCPVCEFFASTRNAPTPLVRDEPLGIRPMEAWRGWRISSVRQKIFFRIKKFKQHEENQWNIE